MIKDFNFYAPTQVVFGRNAEEKLPELIKKYGGTKVLVHYGGGSAKRSGLLDKVFGMLKEAGIAYVELGGVVPNPLLSKVMEGVALCRKEKVDFILAVSSTPPRPSVTTHSTRVTRSISGTARLCLRLVCLWV